MSIMFKNIIWFLKSVGKGNICMVVNVFSIKKWVEFFNFVVGFWLTIFLGFAWLVVFLFVFISFIMLLSTMLDSFF